MNLLKNFLMVIYAMKILYLLHSRFSVSGFFHSRLSGLDQILGFDLCPKSSLLPSDFRSSRGLLANFDRGFGGD